MAWHFDPFQHRGPDGKRQVSGATAGLGALKTGSEARNQFIDHADKNQVIGDDAEEDDGEADPG